jgi:hypothetical protein
VASLNRLRIFNHGPQGFCASVSFICAQVAGSNPVNHVVDDFDGIVLACARLA